MSPGGARRVIPNTFAQIVGSVDCRHAVHRRLHRHGDQFVNHAVKGGTAFIVELPGNDEVTPAMIALHAEATLEVITL